MSRFAQALLAAVAASLILVAGASSRAMESAPGPPALLSPAPGSSFTGGTPIVFQVQTVADDSLLMLHVSRSPALSACGVIGSEVVGKMFSSTSDPSVYRAAPTYLVGGWMDTPGTYYWQAYRSILGSGAELCVPSEVRSLTILPGPNLTPPTLLVPAPNQRIDAGSDIAFRIQTHPGDGSLRLRVSVSPAKDPCGKIGSDIAAESFSATVDPLLYEAKPLHMAGGWMDTPGTYYWQAYRIEYGGGADGCVESEVRSLTITSPPPRKLAAARLEGAFKIKLRVRTTHGIKHVKSGRTYIEGWTFAPRCADGSCKTIASASAQYSTLGSWTLMLKQSGATYKKGQSSTLLRCLFTPVPGPLKVTVRVTKGAWVGLKWRATQIKGSFQHSVKASSTSGYRCKAATMKATLQGSLLQ